MDLLLCGLLENLKTITPCLEDNRQCTRLFWQNHFTPPNTKKAREKIQNHDIQGKIS